MRFVMLTLALVSLPLTSCAQPQAELEELQKRVEMLEEENTELKEVVIPVRVDEFKRKEDCQKYVTQIEARMKQEDEETSYSEDFRHSSGLERVFFSKSQNSCLYYITRTLWSEGRPKTESYLLYDYLENELLLSGGATYEQNLFEARDRFERSMENYE